jgi:protein phosphatase
VRENNEDSWRSSLEDSLFVVADGLGGHQAGEVAAKEAMDCFFTTFEKVFHHDAPLVEDAVIEGLQTCFEVTNDHVYKLSCTHELLRGMGTTICALMVRENQAYVSHIGDSRVYRFRDGSLEQLTKDHCWTRGLFSRKNAVGQMSKGVLTRALGTMPTVEPTIKVTDVKPKDLYLLCSDGLSDMVTNAEIESAFKEPMTVGERVRMLIRLAKNNGGGDNVTVIVVEVLDG